MCRPIHSAVAELRPIKVEMPELHGSHRDRQLARMQRAAQDPGVQEFASLIRESRAIQKRFSAWLEANQGKTTKTVKALEICTGNEPSDTSCVDFIFRDFIGVNWALENFCDVVEGQVIDCVLPEAFTK